MWPTSGAPARLLAASIATSGAVVVPGCSGDPTGAAQSAARARFDRPLQVDDQGPAGRLVHGAFGATRVPAQPQRVVAFGMTVTDQLIVLGVKPVAAMLHMSRLGGRFADHERPFLAGVDGLPYDVGITGLAAERPDLILVSSPQNLLSLDQLGQAAPTVAIGSIDPRQQLRDVAAVVGRSEEATRKLAEYDAGLALARQRLAPFAGQTVALLRLHLKQFRLYGDKLGGAPAIYDELGLHPPPFVKEHVISKDLMTFSIRDEMLPELDADQILVFVDPPSREHMRHLLAENPLWQATPAVQAGHIHYVSSALIWDTILAREHITDEVLRAFDLPPVFGT
jgi:ABC-type Fe3+-hydroxamate transport system substrate-binding protein